MNQPIAHGAQLVCYLPAPSATWKIFLPTLLLNNAVQWYHLSLGHVGSARLRDTMSQHLYHPILHTQIEQTMAQCKDCQKNKTSTCSHGQLVPRKVSSHLWQEVAVDLIGPWKLSIHNVEVSFTALVIIDLVTNLVELICVNNKTSAHVVLQFKHAWLAWYLTPRKCLHDQGSKFLGCPLQQMLAAHGIQSCPTTAKNPQANAICERMHQMIGNSIHTMQVLTPPLGLDAAYQLVDHALANCLFATQSVVHSGLQSTPGALAFGRNMILNIPTVADWNLIRQHYQQLVDKRLLATSRQGFSHDYNVGDKVLKLHYKPDKLSPRAHGSYTIHTVHTNAGAPIYPSH